MLKQQKDGRASMSVVAGASDTKLVLTRTALSAVAAMTAEMASGGRPERWLSTLQSLSKAGLDLGDLDRLAAVMTPPPPTMSDLLIKGGVLALRLQQGDAKNESDGWWQAATGQLSGFITLRSTEDRVSARQTPVSDFEAALSASDLPSAMIAAQKVTGVDENLLSERDSWVAETQRRLVLDEELVTLASGLSADLAILLASETAPSVDGTVSGGDS